MPVRMVLTRQTGFGEQIQIDVAQWNPVTGDIVHDTDEVQQLSNDMLTIVDTRKAELEHRFLQAGNFEKYFTPEIWAKVISILNVLAGKEDPVMVINRWDAAIEETTELERGRVEAYSKMNQPIVCRRCREQKPRYLFVADDIDPLATTCEECKGA